MTDNNHPITPPPELIAKWAESMCGYYKAARWGADTELEACCEVLACELICDGRLVLAGELICDGEGVATDLRAIRRPKPPSLKEQALKALKHAPGPDYPNPITLLTASEHALIRRALESLPD